MGHTPVLIIGDNCNSWAGLMNPPDSGVNLYINTFTVSNSSNIPFQAQLWLNSRHSGKATISTHVSPTNTIIDPLPDPAVVLAFASHVKDKPSNGVSLFTRIAEANSTVVGNYYGKIVIPPGGSFTVYLDSPKEHNIKAELAFGWWEEQRYHIPKSCCKYK
jgi:hypothetical protein